jgi:hypothetical protein
VYLLSIINNEKLLEAQHFIPRYKNIISYADLLQPIELLIKKEASG